MEENDCSLHNGMAWHGLVWILYVFAANIEYDLINEDEC